VRFFFFFSPCFSHRTSCRKERFLQLRELFKAKPEVEDDQVAQAEPGSGDTWMSRVVAAIVNNVQVTVNRIHIRFEESTFACGVSLNSLGALSCDEEFQPKLASSAGGIVRKLCSMDSLSVYWDSGASPLTFDSTEDFCQKMRAELQNPHHQFILHPLSGKLHATINQREEPKLSLRAMFDQLEVSMHEQQFQDASSVGERFSLEARGAPYRRLRPEKPASPRQMWQFVVKAVQQDLAVRRSIWKWPWIQAMMNDRRDYVHLWCQVQIVGGVDKLPIMDLEKLRSLEFRLEYDSIVQFRELGELLYEKKLALAEEAMEQAQKEGGWLGRVVWGTPQAEKQRVLEQDVPVTGALLQDLSRALLSRSEHQLFKDVRDHEGVAVDLSVKKICVALCTWDNKASKASDLMLVNLGDIAAHMSIGASKIFRFDMASLMATEFVSVPGKPTLTVSHKQQQQQQQLKESQSSGSLLSLGLSLNSPGHEVADVVVELETKPVDVIFSMAMVDRLTRFFTSAESVMLDELMAQASESVATLERQVVNQIRGIASGSRRTRLMLKINVNAPNVVIPSDFQKPDCVRAVAVLGKIRFKSILVNESDVVKYGQDGKAHVSMDYFYQQAFDISASNINVLLCNQEDWRSAANSVQRSELLKDFGLHLSIALLTFPTPCLPKLKLTGTVSPIKGFVCAESVVGLMRVVDAITASSAAGSSDAPPPLQQAQASSAQLSDFFDSGSPSNELAEDEFQLDNFVFDRALVDTSKNPKVIDVSFSMEQIDVLVFKWQPTGNEVKDILELQMKGVQLQFVQHRRNLGFHLHLASLGVADKLSSTSQWMLDGVHLPEDEHLLHFSYTGVPRNSTLFKGVDHEIKTKLSNVSFSFNRETVLYILNTVETITSGISKGKKEAPSHSVDFVKSDSENRRLSVSSSRRQSTVFAASPAEVVPATVAHASLDHTTNLLLKVELGSVTAQLCREQDVLAVLEARSSDAVIDVRCNGTLSISGSFGWFQLRSPSASKWVKVAYVNRSATGTAAFGMETFSPQVEGYPGYDTKVQLQMSTIKVVYRAAFVEEVVSYFHEMEKMHSFLFTAAGSAVESGSQSTSKVALDVTVNNPFIKVPRASGSDEYLKLNLGKTTVISSFEGGVQKLSLGVNQIGAHACVLGKPQEQVEILHDIDVALLIQIPLADDHAGGRDDEKVTSVMCVVSKVALMVDDRIADLLVGILDGNLCEPMSAALPPVAASSKPKEAPAKAASSTSQPAAKMAIVCRVEEVSATIVSIASFHLKRIYFDMSGEELVLTVEELLMSDQRPDRSDLYKEIISKRPVSGKQKGSVRMSMVDSVLRCELKKNVTTVTLNPLRVVLTAPCLMQLVMFQARVVDNLNKALAKMKPATPPENMIAAVADVPHLSDAALSAAVEAETAGSSIHVVMKGFEAYAIESQTQSDSRAMALSFSGAVTVKSAALGQKIDLELVDFVLNRVLNMSTGAFVAVVSPWRIGLSLDSVSNRLMRIDVLLSELDVVFSHGEYTLFMVLYLDAMRTISPESFAKEELERKRRENSMPVVGKMVFEPPRVHKEASLLHLMLEAEPISLAACEDEAAPRWLSVGFNGTRLCLSEKSDTLWLLDGGKLALGMSADSMVCYDEEAKTVTVGKSGKPSEWIFSGGMFRLASKQDWVLTAVGDWVELRQIEADSCNQVWIVGKRSKDKEELAPPSERKQVATPQERNPLMVECLNVTFHGVYGSKKKRIFFFFFFFFFFCFCCLKMFFLCC
jgi:hypothetical protein